MDGVIDYLSASQAVTHALAGKPVTTAGRTIRLGAVTVAPAAGGKLALGVSFVGDAKGTIHLIGTPMYDAELRVVTVPDVDFDLTTSNQVLQAYAWLQSDVLRNTLRRSAAWSAAPAVDRGRDLLRQGLNRRIGDAMQAVGEDRLGFGDGPLCHARRTGGARRSDGSRRRVGRPALIVIPNVDSSSRTQ